MFTTEQIAYMCAKFPHIKGSALCAYNTCDAYSKDVKVCGYRKPELSLPKDQARLDKYIKEFNKKYHLNPSVKNKPELREKNILLSVRHLKQFFFFGKGINRAKLKLANAKKLPRVTDNVYYCKSLLKSQENIVLIAHITDGIYYQKPPYKYIAININIADSIVWYCVRTMIYPMYAMNNTSEREEQLREQLIINEQKLTTINKKELELSNELKRIKTLYIKGKIDDEEFELMESDNIKNKGVLSDSKTLLIESNTNIQQALKNTQEHLKINLIDISHLDNDVEIKKIIDICVKSITIAKEENILKLDIQSVFGINYYFSYNLKTKEIKFLDSPIDIKICYRYSTKRKKG